MTIKREFRGWKINIKMGIIQIASISILRMEKNSACFNIDCEQKYPNVQSYGDYEPGKPIEFGVILDKDEETLGCDTDGEDKPTEILFRPPSSEVCRKDWRDGWLLVCRESARYDIVLCFVRYSERSRKLIWRKR